tara:strand:+ start:56 stop:640 length:585 start_codon:yes stop_codon:yes gene_type:complete
MNNKELGKKAAKGVLGAAAAVGVASAAGVDMSGIIRRISISLIGLGLFLGVFLGIAGQDANLFFALTGIGIFLAAVWFLIATLATWIFTGSTKSKKSTKLEGERSELLDDEQNLKKTIKENFAPVFFSKAEEDKKPSIEPSKEVDKDMKPITGDVETSQSVKSDKIEELEERVKELELKKKIQDLEKELDIDKD